MSDIDITLPDRVPEMSRYHDINTGLKPFALYILAHSTADLNSLLETTNSLCPRNDYVKAPPRTVFKNGPLKSVIDYHLTLCSDLKTFDPRYFLAVTLEDWRDTGILVVTLDDDDLECKPDLFQIKAEDSGILLVNLQIGNTDWYEAKENYEISTGGGEEDASSTTDDPNETFPDGALKKKPGPGFYIAIYAIQGVDVAELIRTIQPAHDKQTESEYVCRFEGHLSTDDPVDQAMTSHSQQCTLNPYLHKNMFFLVDNEDYKERGLLLCNVQGEKRKRVKCNVHTLVPNFCSIARGQQGWDDLKGMQ